MPLSRCSSCPPCGGLPFLSKPRDGVPRCSAFIDRDGFWYATKGHKAGRYRPYEAPSELPTAYFFLTRSEPQFFAQRGVQPGDYEGTKEGIATYRTPLSAPMLEQLVKVLGGMEELNRQHPEQATKPETTEAIRRIQELVSKGIPLKIDIASGMVVQLGTAEKQTEFRDFRWLDQIPDEEFEVQGRSWEDHTSDPTEGDRTELLMIGHNGIWQVGTKAGDTDGRLLDQGFEGGAMGLVKYRHTRR